MTCIRIVAPVGSVVDLAGLRDQCRVDGTDHDASLTAFGLAAEAYLDGYGGILGRAILPQTWRDTFTGWGELRLTLPDVASVVVSYQDAAGVWITITAPTIERDDRGWFLTATGPDTAAVRVDYVAGLASDKLPVAAVIVRLMVANWFANREAVVTGTIVADLPMAVDALIGVLVWRRVG